MMQNVIMLNIPVCISLKNNASWSAFSMSNIASLLAGSMSGIT